MPNYCELYNANDALRLVHVTKTVWLKRLILQYFQNLTVSYAICPSASFLLVFIDLSTPFNHVSHETSLPFMNLWSLQAKSAFMPLPYFLNRDPLHLLLHVITVILAKQFKHNNQHLEDQNHPAKCPYLFKRPPESGKGIKQSMTF